MSHEQPFQLNKIKAKWRNSHATDRDEFQVNHGTKIERKTEMAKEETTAALNKRQITNKEIDLTDKTFKF